MITRLSFSILKRKRKKLLLFCGKSFFFIGELFFDCWGTTPPNPQTYKYLHRRRVLPVELLVKSFAADKKRLTTLYYRISHLDLFVTTSYYEGYSTDHRTQITPKEDFKKSKIHQNVTISLLSKTFQVPKWIEVSYLCSTAEPW